MADKLDPLVLDLVEWIAKEPRPYAEAIDAWRTSCAKLPVWEDTVDRGFIERRAGADMGLIVVATALGRDFLKLHRRVVP